MFWDIKPMVCHLNAFIQIPFLVYASLDLASPLLRGSGSVNQLKSENWLRGHDLLFLWLNLDFGSLDIELFCS